MRNSNDALNQTPNRDSRRKKGRFRPRSRQVDLIALDQVTTLLANMTLSRDLLLEYLHLIQDKFHCLKLKHLVALADILGLPMAEVYETASFYAHFDIVPDNLPSPPDITVRVCNSLSCQLAASESLMTTLNNRIATQQGLQVRVKTAPCMGRCEQAPVVAVGHRHITCASAGKVMHGIREKTLQPAPLTDYPGYENYRANGGYRLLEACMAGEKTFTEIVEILAQSGLRGLGGAGFPTANKWRFVRQEAKPRYLVINADEGEPGTFKDRVYLEQDPHRFLEGMLIAAWAVEATAAYIYLRDEYPGIRQVLLQEIAKLKQAGLTPPQGIHVRRGAGAYICGEESAMLESIEGKRGLPRHKPPFASQVGLFGLPTLINNVETVYWIRDIVEKGSKWLSSQGRHSRQGMRSFSVSGRIKLPGVKLAPAGITARELINEFCGGMLDGHQFKAYLPGGASGGILPASKADIPLDFGTLEQYGCFIGSAAVIVLSDQDSAKQAALNLMEFFEEESCGQCTPCRVGTEKAVTLMKQKHWDVSLLGDLSTVMASASICGLGQAAPNPLRCVLEHFSEEITLKEIDHE